MRPADRPPMIAVALAAVAVLLLACGPPAPVRAEIAVEGMHCDGCSSAIEGELGRIEGVLEASADWEAGRATATFDPSKVTEERLRDAIESLGYDVRGVTVEPAAG